MNKLKIVIVFSIMFFSTLTFGQEKQDTIVGIAYDMEQAWALKGQSDTYLFNKAVRYYLEVFKQDSLNKIVNDHLGLLYYNRSIGIQDSLRDIKKGVKVANESKIKEMEKREKYYYSQSLPYTERFERIEKQDSLKK